MALAAAFYALIIHNALAESNFDARKHFSTRTPYHHQGKSVKTQDPAGCVPVNLQVLHSLE
jgi:hypothetical protein